MLVLFFCLPNRSSLSCARELTGHTHTHTRTQRSRYRTQKEGRKQPLPPPKRQRPKIYKRQRERERGEVEITQAMPTARVTRNSHNQKVKKADARTNKKRGGGKNNTARTYPKSKKNDH